VTYAVETTPRFDRRAKRFLRSHPELRERFIAVIEQLQEDPFQPALRLHALGDRLEGQHAVSLTYAYRILLLLIVSEQTITLLDIGDHDAVYR
jgi:mRNA-degrading endonuclease YafQ of YafQ-DinJ toxin-antitoxin module